MSNADMPDIPEYQFNYGRLTKREYFAGLAMHGLMSYGRISIDSALLAVRMADELLKQLEEK